MKDLEAFSQIEKYLNGNMTGEEKSDFENRLQTDSMLAGFFREYKELTGTLQFYTRRKAIKQQLNSYHAELENKQPAVLNPFGNKQKRKVFWNQHYATIAVAASVALLTVFGTLLSVDLWRSMGKQQNARYIQLLREISTIKTNLASSRFNNNANKPANAKPIPANFSGTGFVISPDGYLVTSYHLIKNSDSVFIENKAGQRFKVDKIFRDISHDLAILKIADDDFTSFGTLPYAFKSGISDLGEKVYTLGFPREDMVFGEGSLSSQTGFDGDTTSYQVSIPVNPGNSGGPLLDSQGNLIGIISGKQREQEGAAFAVKSTYLKQLIEQLSADSLDTPINLSKKNLMLGSSRTNQVKKLEDYVFVIKVYNN